MSLVLVVSILHHEWEWILYATIKSNVCRFLYGTMIRNKRKIDKSTDFGCHSSLVSATCDNSGNFTHGKTGWHNSRGMMKPLPFWKRGDRMDVFLNVEQALRRKVVLKLVWFTTQGFYFCGGKSNLSETISLGYKSEVCFILGDWHEIHST